MRNRKEDNKILYTNKTTGEFITKRRFNNHDYILTSIFDDEDDELKNKYHSLNESFLDELDDDDDEDVIDNNFAEIKPGVMMTTTDGSDYIVEFVDNDIIDGFVRYIRSILLIDSKDKEHYKKISDIVINNGIKNSCRVYFSRIVSENAIPKYVVSTNKHIGYIELQYADKSLTRVNFIIYPMEGVRVFGYSKSFSSMSYEHYQFINKEHNLNNKPCEQYYSALVDRLVKMFNEKEMNITLCQRSDVNEIPDKYRCSTQVFDQSFVKYYLKPVCIYGPGRNSSMSNILNVVDSSSNMISDLYYEDKSISLRDLYDDKNFVIIAQANKFFSRLFKSCWKEQLNYTDFMVKMGWIPKTSVTGSKKYALCMPMSMFLIAAPIFYMMLSNDSII